MKLSVYEYLQELNKNIKDILDMPSSDFKDKQALRRYLQVSKLLFIAEKILEKDLIDYEKERGKK